MTPRLPAAVSSFTSRLGQPRSCRCFWAAPSFLCSTRVCRTAAPIDSQASGADSMYGLVLIGFSLVMDAVTGGLQERAPASLGPAIAPAIHSTMSGVLCERGGSNDARRKRLRSRRRSSTRRRRGPRLQCMSPCCGPISQASSPPTILLRCGPPDPCQGDLWQRIWHSSPHL